MRLAIALAALSFAAPAGAAADDIALYQEHLLKLAEAEAALANCGAGKGEAGLVAEAKAGAAALAPGILASWNGSRAELEARFESLVLSAFALQRAAGGPCFPLTLPGYQTVSDGYRRLLLGIRDDPHID